MKYQKDKAEAKDSLSKKAVPTCRFWFFRILLVKRLIEGVMRRRRVRRRGKALIAEPYVEASSTAQDRYWCKVKREQPFRSASNDCAQSGNRCNTDFQYLATAPLLPEEVRQESTEALELGGAADVQHEAASLPGPGRREKRGVGIQLTCLGVAGGKQMSEGARLVVESSVDAFRKAMAMDYYITKYQGKMMQALSPLFKTLLNGIRRLRAEEEAEERQDP